MAAPIIAAGAIGSTLLVLLGLVLLFHVTKTTEVYMLIIGAVALAYIYYGA